MKQFTYQTTNSGIVAIDDDNNIWYFCLESWCWRIVPGVPHLTGTVPPPPPVVPRQHEPEPEEDVDLFARYAQYTDDTVLSTYVKEFTPQTRWEESFMETMAQAYDKKWNISRKQRLSMLRGLDKRKLLGHFDDEDVPF